MEIVNNERTVIVEFNRLNEASQQTAISVANWLRKIAVEIEDPNFRAKVDQVFSYGYCRPLNID